MPIRLGCTVQAVNVVAVSENLTIQPIMREAWKRFALLHAARSDAMISSKKLRAHVAPDNPQWKGDVYSGTGSRAG